jgi:FkbM family methyltransferase
MVADASKPKMIMLDGRPTAIHGADVDHYFRNLELVAGTFAFVRRLIGEYVLDGQTCIDAGANLGLTAILASRLLPNSKIYAFEPSPSAYDFLVRNIALNDAVNVETLAIALGDRSGEMDFFEDANFLAGSHLSPGTTPSNVKVRLDCLDHFVAQRGMKEIGFIKIDVEGSEPGVIDGARQVLWDMKPIVLMEINVWALLGFQDINPRRFLQSIGSEFGTVLYPVGPEIKQASTPAEFDHLLHTAIELYRGTIDIAFSADSSRLHPMSTTPIDLMPIPIDLLPRAFRPAPRNLRNLIRFLSKEDLKH